MIFKEIFFNQYFYIAFIAWFIAQVSKVITTLVIERKLNIYRMIGSGGMPSSHSSFVMGLTTSIGLDKGWDSAFFATALVFSLVIMYDASGVRRAVGKQAMILNTMIDDLAKHKHIEQEKLKELIGHTPYEVFVGAILGIVIANLMM